MSSSNVRSMNGTKSGDVPVTRSQLFLLELANTAGLPRLLRQDIGSIIPDASTKPGSRLETDQTAPIVTVMDLAKDNIRGDTVSIDVQHDLSNLPKNCCDPLEGDEEDMTYASFEVKIGITRHGVRTTCPMDEVRMGKNVFNRARPLLKRYMERVKTERLIYQLAGARGHNTTVGSPILPLDGMNFRKAMINCLEAPTACRHFFGGDAEAFEGLDRDDTFTLDSLTRIMAAMEESSHPLAPVKVEGLDDLKYMLLVTPAQWRDFKLSTDGRFYRELQSNAVDRAKNCAGHPAFSGECLFWDGILVKKYTLPVRFLPGHGLLVSNDDDCASTRTARIAPNADFVVDRALLVGGAAIVEAYGAATALPGKREGRGRDVYSFWEGEGDGGFQRKVHVACLDGEKKIRFASKEGRVYDHGVAVLDTAVRKDSIKAC